MLIKDLEKLRKRTLRERIYEEIVHLILSGELPSSLSDLKSNAVDFG
jgi:DNA-binding GntR family transcriptional regulator